MTQSEGPGGQARPFGGTGMRFRRSPRKRTEHQPSACEPLRTAPLRPTGQQSAANSQKLLPRHPC
jgi:hypothetical protein